MLMLNIGVNVAFLIASIVLLTSPVLEVNEAVWRDGQGVALAERGIQVLLVTVAFIVAYEIARDIRRLLRN